MKNFFSKKKNVVILLVVLAVLIIAAGIIFAVKSYKNKEKNVQRANEIAILKEKSKTEVLGKDKEEDNNEHEEKYTEQYEKYLELSDEEKKETEVVPKKYEVNYTVINNIIEDQKKDTDTNIKDKNETDKKTDIDFEFVTPKKFNLADKIKIKTEDQGAYGLCWDFAATKSLETNLALTQNKNYDFSEMHVNYVTSELLLGNRWIDDGGSFENYENYLIDSGAVLEEDVGYQDYNQEEYEKFLEIKPVVTVTKTVNFPTIYKYEGNELTNAEIETVRNAVKNHIMNYGSLYAQISTSDYNENKNNLYTSPEANYWIDHAVSIVGWDDNYSKENFPEGHRPQNNGAYIALNSWGDSFGENGYFYISYEDKYVESGMSGIVSTSMKDAYKVADIDNPIIKNVITSKLSNTFKEYKKEEYVTTLALSKINDLDFSNMQIDDLDGIDLFTNLYKLNLSNNNLKEKDLKELLKLNQLYSLNLANSSKIKDVSILKDSMELINLNLSGNEGIKGYENIETLLDLDLSNCDLQKVKQISNIPELASLNVSENEKIKDWNSLKELENLYSLKAEECNIEDISQIANLNQINQLELAKNNITDIIQIGNLKKLTYLDLSQNNITDFSKIEEIKEINEDEEYYPSLALVLEDCSIKDISLFNSLTNVYYLDLSNNDISDLSAFYNNSVYELDLSGNKNLKNIQYLNNLENLYCLYLEDCNIEDVSSISKIHQIEILDLAKNQITNIEQLNSLNNLYALSLEGNNGLEGNLDIDTLNCLNLSNTKYNKGIFDFYKCSNLGELNLSKCEDIDLIKEVLNNCTNLYYIILEDSTINAEILDLVNKNGVWLVGGTIKIEIETDKPHDEIEELDLNEIAYLKQAISRSISTRTVDVSGGNINQSINKIIKTSVNGVIVIKIGYGEGYSNLITEIEYKEKEEEAEQEENTNQEKTDTNTNKNEKDTNKTISDDYEMVED